MAEEGITATVTVTLTKDDGTQHTMSFTDVPVSEVGIERPARVIPTTGPFVRREPGPFSIIRLTLNPKENEHPYWTAVDTED